MIYHVYSSQRTPEGEKEVIIARNLKLDDARAMASRLTEERRKAFPQESSWTGVTYGLRLNKSLVESTPEMLEALDELVLLDPPCPFQSSDPRYPKWFAWFHKAQVAVRKARGAE